MSVSLCPAANLDSVLEAAADNQEILTSIQDSLQCLPSADDDVTILRVHDSCEESLARLHAVQAKTAELDDLVNQAESKVGHPLTI